MEEPINTISSSVTIFQSRTSLPVMTRLPLTILKVTLLNVAAGKSLPKEADASYLLPSLKYTRVKRRGVSSDTGFMITAMLESDDKSFICNTEASSLSDFP